MKIGLICASSAYPAILTDINGRDVRIRLPGNAVSEEFKCGMPVKIELPDGAVQVMIQDVSADEEWIELRCRARKVFPAIVIGCHT